jgi:hypothetical protein
MDSISLDFPEEISYIVLLEDWEIAADQLKLLDKKLGGGQFGIVRQGLLTSGKGDPEVVAVKTLRGNTERCNDINTVTNILNITIIENILPTYTSFTSLFRARSSLVGISEFSSRGRLYKTLNYPFRS